jgi:hypothetical protein
MEMEPYLVFKLKPTLNSSPKWQEPKDLKFQRLSLKDWIGSYRKIKIELKKFGPYWNQEPNNTSHNMPLHQMHCDNLKRISTLNKSK